MNAMHTLITDEKISEHSMLVDLGRNDIHRVSITGTSEISKLMVIEKYEHVMHIVSEVKGKIKKIYLHMTSIAVALVISIIIKI